MSKLGKHSIIREDRYGGFNFEEAGLHDDVANSFKNDGDGDFLGHFMGLILRNLRHGRRLSLEAISEQTFIPAEDIVNLEAGQQALTITQLFVLADVLGFQPNEFLAQVHLANQFLETRNR